MSYHIYMFHTAAVSISLLTTNRSTQSYFYMKHCLLIQIQIVV